VHHLQIVDPQQITSSRAGALIAVIPNGAGLRL